MIPTWLYKGLFYGCLVCVVLALIWYAYGPKNEPPRSLSVEGFEAKVRVTSRSWLTWD